MGFRENGYCPGQKVYLENVRLPAKPDVSHTKQRKDTLATKPSWFSRLFGRHRTRSATTSEHEGTTTAEAASYTEAKHQAPWTAGHVFLEDFVVERELGAGGMGKVYLLQSRTTGERFAVKKTLTLSPENQQNFLAELQTWIDLPAHPHLTACRFFRTIGSEIAIFAEYVDGGSLAEWIQDRKLTRLDQILDVAIQFAWGVHAAHELGLIHQDIKPANVLMTSEGIAKVTDFGLARARASAGEPTIGGLEQSILVSSGGFTPAYCSPEQADAAEQRKAGVAPERLTRLTRRTDIWSWAVSVLEMFAGEPPCRHAGGQIADAVFEAFLETGSDEPQLPTVPAGVADVLRKCLRRDPAERWPTMAEAADALAHAYRKTAGQEYPRKAPPVPTRHGRTSDQHDRWTTTGVQWTDPREWLVKALQADGRDAAEADSMICPRTGSRRAQAIADLAAYDAARQILERLVARGRKDLETPLATLCFEKAFVHEGADDIPGCLEMYDRAIEIWERLVNQEGRRELANDLATAYLNNANAVSALGDHRAAVALYDRAIEIRERLVNQEGRRELANELARAYMNKAAAVRALGDNRAAMKFYDRAIEIQEHLVNQEGRSELVGDLAWARGYRAELLLKNGDRPGATTEARAAVSVLQAEIARTGRADLQSVLNWAKTALKDVL